MCRCQWQMGRINDGFFADTPQYMTVNKNSPHAKEAVEFLNYFYNNETAQETLKDVEVFRQLQLAEAYVQIRGC